jgi:PAS domain S-box-containing protein
VSDHAPIAMLVVDLDRTIVDANTAMGELLGLPAARAARPVGGRARRPRRPTCNRSASCSPPRSDGYRRERELLRKDGTSVWVLGRRVGRPRRRRQPRARASR